MINLFEVLQQARDGGLAGNLARQYGLSQDQAMAAMDALLPAFTTGLRRNAATAEGLGALLGAAASGRHESYFDEPARSFSEEGIREGNGILGHLFGSKDVSRAVADRAAAVSGLDPALLKKMLPAVATMVMGSLFKQGAQPGAGGVFGQILERMIGGGTSGGDGNPLGDILGQVLGGGRSQGGGGPLGDILGGALGGGAGGAQNPLGDILGGLFGGGGDTDRERDRSPAGGGNPPGDVPGGFFGEDEEKAEGPERRRGMEDILGQMFDTGRQVRDDYQKNIDDIFDSYLSGMRR